MPTLNRESTVIKLVNEWAELRYGSHKLATVLGSHDVELVLEFAQLIATTTASYNQLCQEIDALIAFSSRPGERVALRNVKRWLVCDDGPDDSEHPPDVR